MQFNFKKIAFIGSYPPQRCGIGTFTRDLFESFATTFPHILCSVIAVSDITNFYNYPAAVVYEIEKEDINSYLQAAEFIRINEFDLVCVQHEFGIFGGNLGSYFLSLLDNIHIPVVMTLHTVLNSGSQALAHQFENLYRLSTRIVVIASKGFHLLTNEHTFSPEIIDIIPHGIPEMHPSDTKHSKSKLKIEDRFVVSTYGLLSPDKGIEYVIRAIPEIKKFIPNVLYIVSGTTHPRILKEQGEKYRTELITLVHKLHIDDNITFLNEYASPKQLKEIIGATDICILPYLNEKQISSGTLSYCLGAAKAVISTPFWHAAELIESTNGILVPFRDTSAIVSSVSTLYNNPELMSSIQQNAYRTSKKMVWSEVVHKYATSFEKASQLYSTARRRRFQNVFFYLKDELPKFNFDHLLKMTDSTGILQHAKYAYPDFTEGYCTDDNARALLLTVSLEHLGIDIFDIIPVQTRAISFLNFAFNPDNLLFRNFMSFSRCWKDNYGSEDSHGRALWALGCCIELSKNDTLRALANTLFSTAISSVMKFTSPRALSFSLLGIIAYLKRFCGNYTLRKWGQLITDRLYSLFLKNSTSEWPWCEDNLTYDNARIIEALLQGGKFFHDKNCVDLGLKSLRWLIEIQTSKDLFFIPIGSNGFYKKGSLPSRYDQQPIEAAAMISASVEAFSQTSDYFWVQSSEMIFGWFMGRNELSISLYDDSSGGCKDGLSVHRINKNEGAESLLSYLLSLADIYKLKRMI